ncbi:hypothetical protein L3Q82_004562 [Scortum barcoo]|uniref:Uncharacterized protein n=1 Tax=Scortum barcoo TaxID=214431 RepID=A0ACB8VH67_9TELE|nr:hypothetical protein L3Q82_004562 [Scortum barcoo]
MENEPRRTMGKKREDHSLQKKKNLRRQRRLRKQKRGKRGGLRARLQANPYRPAFPSLFLTNARSLVNKMDEMKLKIVSAKIDSCVAIVTETWLDNNIPDAAVELAGRSLLLAVRTAASEKHRGGGLALYIHNAWCTATNIIATYCFLIWNIWQ